MEKVAWTKVNSKEDAWIKVNNKVWKKDQWLKKEKRLHVE
jgi:hypothetical protein